MKIRDVDLNLLLYLDVLLKERSVSQAAVTLGITQPAMSSSLKRLRALFKDPILVRSSLGMVPTEKALDLQPMVRKILCDIEGLFADQEQFSPSHIKQVFRIMCSDYAEATLLPKLISRLRIEAPDVVLDCLTPSDVNYIDLEQGRIDLAINRFEDLPKIFYQKTIWQEGYACLMNKDYAHLDHFNLEHYLAAQHIWVSKTGLGVGYGVTPERSGGIDWVDLALGQLGKKRKITCFTRHYMMPAVLIAENDLIATVPKRIAVLFEHHPQLVLKAVPFFIPDFELKMAWSPLVQQGVSHRWFRQLLMEVALADEAMRDARPIGLSEPIAG